jgi:hypothetical protein
VQGAFLMPVFHNHQQKTLARNSDGVKSTRNHPTGRNGEITMLKPNIQLFAESTEETNAGNGGNPAQDGGNSPKTA